MDVRFDIFFTPSYKALFDVPILVSSLKHLQVCTRMFKLPEAKVSFR